MKKLSVIAAAAAFAAVTAAPVAAETKNDPFVSTQGSIPLIGGLGAGATIAVAVVVVSAVAAISSSDGS